jgi:hypothetical protein
VANAVAGREQTKMRDPARAARIWLALAARPIEDFITVRETALRVFHERKHASEKVFKKVMNGQDAEP